MEKVARIKFNSVCVCGSRVRMLLVIHKMCQTDNGTLAIVYFQSISLVGIMSVRVRAPREKTFCKTQSIDDETIRSKISLLLVIDFKVNSA